MKFKLKIPISAHIFTMLGGVYVVSAINSLPLFDSWWKLFCIFNMVIGSILCTVGLIFAYEKGKKDGQKS